MARACSDPDVRLPGAAPESPGVPHALAIPGLSRSDPSEPPVTWGAWAIAPAYWGSCATNPNGEGAWGQKPGSTPPLPLGLGLGEVDDGVTDGDGEAPFWTKM